jgi:hypothetical protein
MAAGGANVVAPLLGVALPTLLLAAIAFAGFRRAAP